jgi:fluoride exporter
VTVLIWICVGLLGGCGAVLRFRLDGFVQQRFAGSFPLGTMVVNVLGCFILGVLTGGGVTGNALLLGGTAVLGSFTTFSTWMLETQRLAEEHEESVAALNIGLPLAAGLVAAAVGWAFGALL